MSVYLHIGVVDPFKAYALADRVVVYLRGQGIALVPVADGSMGGLTYEFVQFANILLDDVSLHNLARTAVELGEQNPSQIIEVEQDRRVVQLTLDETENYAILRSHLKGSRMPLLRIR